MSDLVTYFWQNIYSQIDQKNRYSTVIQFEDVLLVNFDCLYNRERSIRAVDQLLYYLHQKGKDKRFIFLSEDGANLAHTGAFDVIVNIINHFKLTEETCLVVCRESIEITNATVEVKDSIPYWCNVLIPSIHKIPIPQGKFSKKFAIWFNRGTIFRAQITKHLYENYREQSLISYQESGVLVDDKMSEYFSEIINWANQNTPIIYDQIFPNRQYTHNMIVGTRHSYEEYFMEIVCETDILGTSWITEKTVKNLYIGKPFIVMSGPGTLAKLRQFGFKTFSPFINESYDLIENHYDRLQAILTEVDRIASLDINELQHNIKPILEHNRSNYVSLLRTNK